MKKGLFGILTVALVVLLALTSCNPEVNAFSDELVSIQFDNAVSKGLESSIDYVAFDDIYWTYTAEKTDALGQKGATTSETPVNDGTGLAGTIGGFSQGSWKFTLNGYLEAEHTNLIYVGVPTDVKLVKSDNPTAIPVTVKLNASGDGKIVFDDIAFDFDGSADVTVAIKAGATDIYTGVIKAADDYVLDDEFELAAGSYAFNVIYSCESEEETYILATSSVNVKVVSGMTTVIKGSLDEDTCEITYESDEAINMIVIHADNTISGYATLAAAAQDAVSGDVIVLFNDLEDCGSVTLKTGVALDGNSKTISGSSNLNMSDDTVVTNVHFKDIANAKGNLSAIYAKAAAGSYEITNCIFENIQYEALQICPTSADACITISGNSFINAGSRRNIHIQSASSMAFKTVITNNSFTDIAVSDTPIEVYCVANASDLEISGNYVEMEHPEVCILDKLADGTWVNIGPGVATNGFVDENGDAITFATAIALDGDKTTFYEDASDAPKAKIVFINSVEDLKALNATQTDKTYILTTDLDLENQAWTPVTGSTSQFTGTFDGCNHTISNLNAETKTPKASGLFGEVVGTIKNLTVVNATVKGNDYVGVIVGKMWGDVTNCKVYNATVTANPFLKEVGGTEYDGGAKAGAIIGYGADGGNRSNNYVENATINAYRDLGGIAGYAQGTSLLRYSTVKNVSLNYIQIPEGFTYDGNTPNQNMGDFAGRYDAGLDTTGSVVLD